MATIARQTQLQNLQPGDRITHYGADLCIEDYSVYQALLFDL